MEEDERKQKFEQLLDDLPLLHSWDKGVTWKTGGFRPGDLRVIWDLIESNPQKVRIIETGAGNTTLCFLLSKAESVTSIAPDQSLFDRITLSAQERGIDYQILRQVVSFSEDILPRIAEEAKRDDLFYNFALIDGGHGWPTVFVDFFYMMAMLKVGGFLMVDDINLFSVKQLARLLNESNEFSVVKNLKKAIIFRKDTTNVRMTDFGAQPYIKRMTQFERSAGKEFILDC